MTAQVSTQIYEGGFSDPVFGSQTVFRAVMDAMANPGRVIDLGQLTQAPAPLEPAAGAVLAALADYDTPLCFEAQNNADAAAWLTFHTGAPVTADRANAAFAVLVSRSAVGTWSDFAIGTSSFPDRSTTLLLPVEDLRSGKRLTLNGPGIEHAADIAPAGLPEGFASAMGENAKLFPLGFDLLLVCGSELIALPRTTRIMEN
ncbi:phosphonate C-P lyase system protein PhnH [Tianweitania sp. BSSL-BM11]|uniref:Phosphonate C-P lyase system protein PhnH n=1 Tax=Tianweitania aestuarii TaxID=2814886 RepID=A0ABS5RR64_9HYPH|nr:phosphonate C-P lyase system protein PhnH [Tianweitania aestuarii]MBS9719541.1 phosphonate C-P lyase system protein PhnH [Tianweitania aestuarii]